MALDHAGEGIRINCVCPGYMMTPMTQFLRDNMKLHEDTIRKIPMNRGADPAEIGRVVLFLASDDASYITGQGMHHFSTATLALMLTCASKLSSSTGESMLATG